MGMNARAVVLTACTAMTACSTMSEITAAPAVALPTRENASPGAAVEAHAGLGFSNRDAIDTAGVDLSAKAKVTPVTQNLAFGEGFYLASKWGAGVGMFRAGLHLVFERYDQKVIVGGGPYGSLSGGFVLTSREYDSPGIMINERRRERMLLTVGPTIELDARFSRPSAVTFIGLAIGLAWADEGLEANVHLPSLRPRQDPASRTPDVSPPASRTPDVSPPPSPDVLPPEN
jgi:hypothetical protein